MKGRALSDVEGSKGNGRSDGGSLTEVKALLAESDIKCICVE